MSIYQIRVTKDGDRFVLRVLAASTLDAVRQVLRWFGPHAKSLTLEV